MIMPCHKVFFGKYFSATYILHCRLTCAHTISRVISSLEMGEGMDSTSLSYLLTLRYSHFVRRSIFFCFITIDEYVVKKSLRVLYMRREVVRVRRSIVDRWPHVGEIQSRLAGHS